MLNEDAVTKYLQGIAKDIPVFFCWGSLGGF